MKTTNTVYQCDVCNRKSWFTVTNDSVGLLPICNITAKCPGIMRKVLSRSEVLKTPIFTPEVANVVDWTQRKVLHNQTFNYPLNVWIIIHNLQAIPNIHVYEYNSITETNDLLDDSVYTLAIVDENTMTVTFKNQAMKQGSVQCVASNSRNTIAKKPVDTSATLIPVSTTSGQITVAVTNGLPVTLTFINNMTNIYPTVSINYILNGAPSQDSPWYGTPKVFIDGKQYTVYSFNLVSDINALPIFSNGLVDQGATLYVDGDSHPELLFLLADAPFTVNDTTLDKYLDSKTVSIDNIKMIYTDASISVDDTYLKNTFPPIYKIQ